MSFTLILHSSCLTPKQLLCIPSCIIVARDQNEPGFLLTQPHTSQWKEAMCEIGYWWQSFILKWYFCVLIKQLPSVYSQLIDYIEGKQDIVKVAIIPNTWSTKYLCYPGLTTGRRCSISESLFILNFTPFYLLNRAGNDWTFSNHFELMAL